jgi:DNA helicase HerA-like ATPase
MLKSCVAPAVLGTVLDVNGDRATCLLDLGTLTRLRQEGANTLIGATSIGCYVKIGVGGHWLIGSISEIETDRAEGASVKAVIDFLGEGPRRPDDGLAGFQRGVTYYPLAGDAVCIAHKADLNRVFSPESQPHIEIGTVHPTADVRASLLYDKLLSRHFAVLGSTGCGKSTLVSLMLHRIMAASPEGHIVVLDPHGEYAAAFASTGQVYNVDNLEIPYWMMNLEEHCEAFIPDTEESREVDINVMAKCLLAARSRNDEFRNRSEVTVDSPVPYVEGDLIDALDEEMGKLEKQAELQTYLRLKLNIEQFFSDPRYKFIFSYRLRQKSMTEFLSHLLRIPVGGKPISIIDLSGAPSQIVKVIVSLLSRIILDFAIWTPADRRTPVLLVCEEAQRYLPAIHPDKAMSAERQLERIAREGRKYGVSLGLVTQRPSELSETALSQCGTIISMRMTNTNDQAKVKATLPEASRSLVQLVPALQNRECIIAGEGARVPVRVRIDEAEPAIRPASNDPAFSQLWNQRLTGNTMVEEAVQRWRGERYS